MSDKLEMQLLDSALKGDIDCFGSLCGRYYSAMAAVAYAILGDHHLAEDAAQETFARALKNLRKLKSKEKFGLWLAGICRNVAKDMLEYAPETVSIEDCYELPEKSPQEHEDAAVRKALGRLKTDERQLILLRYYSDMSYEQMASVLGRSKAAINNRLIRTRKKIAEYLQKNNGFEEVEL